MNIEWWTMETVDRVRGKCGRLNFESRFRIFFLLHKNDNDAANYEDDANEERKIEKNKGKKITTASMAVAGGDGDGNGDTSSIKLQFAFIYLFLPSLSSLLQLLLLLLDVGKLRKLPKVHLWMQRGSTNTAYALCTSKIIFSELLFMERTTQKYTNCR